jgi:hypothetical protein
MSREAFHKGFVSACRRGDVPQVESLIDEAGEHDWRDGLKVACRESRAGVIDLFQRHGLFDFFEEALLGACQGNNTACAEALLERFTPPYTADPAMWNEAFHMACARKMNKVIAIMVTFDQTDLDGGLNSAAKAGSLEIVHMLIEQGAVPLERTSMRAAVVGGNEDVIKLFLTYHDEYELVFDHGCDSGKVWAVQEAIRIANGRLRSHTLDRGMNTAASVGALEIVQLLFPLVHREAVQQAFATAGRMNQVGIVRFMMHKGLSILLLDMRSCTHQEICVLAVQHGYKPDPADEYRLTNADLIYLYHQGHEDFGIDTKRVDRYKRWRIAVSSALVPITDRDTASVIMHYI